MTEMSTEWESESEIKKPVKDVPVVQDQGLFKHDTGDTYDGYFEAKKKDRSVKMHGPGVYITAEGDSYKGVWENDRLGANDEVTIHFSDDARYEGQLKDWSFWGPGKYYYPDGSVVRCDFNDNCPVGNMVLSDPNGHVWLGKAELGCGWFGPVNHFYEMLEKTRDVSRKHVPKMKEDSVKAQLQKPIKAEQ
ncbi:uncharacterized protein LOC114251593 [Bombyx mandarina]|uniref:Uncharacterized protein LOC114251593 n=1 Tax=Bombyx mandarina TaxID=7092 RepID=A0A6J2KH90_BOMMA|nr:uncharacterized protein LOC114251593 [Bombyx mandarina]